MKIIAAIFVAAFVAGCEEREAQAKRAHEYKMECLKIGGVLLNTRYDQTCVRPAAEKPHD